MPWTELKNRTVLEMLDDIVAKGSGRARRQAKVTFGCPEGNAKVDVVGFRCV